MENCDHYRIFIAYHGTYDLEEGSIEKARALYFYLKNKNINCYFFPEMKNYEFGQTPIIAAHSDLFLLVANQNIKTNQINEVCSNGLCQEIKAFYDQIYSQKRSKGSARVYTYHNLSMEKANDLHLMFNNVEHFNESRFGVDKCFEDVLAWVSSFNLEKNIIINHQQENEIRKSITINDLYEQSRSHFRNSIKDICDIPDDDFKVMFDKYSKLFACNIELKEENYFNVDDDIFNFLIEKIESCSNQNILKITGNNGSDKNTLIQMLYISLYKRSLLGLNDYIPFYININNYEKEDYGSCSDINKYIRERIDKDLSIFMDYISLTPNKIPIIFVDGLRTFKICRTSTEYMVDSIISKNKCIRKIVSVDTGYEQNRARRNEISSLAPSTFKYILKVKSIDLENEKQCLKFLSRYNDIFEIGDIEYIYAKLRSIFFYEVDSYIIRLTVDLLNVNHDNKNLTISDLYHELSMKHLYYKEEELMKTAKHAFDFLYTDIVFDDKEVFAERGWTLIKRHSTFVDYLIAYYYINKLRTFKEKEDLDFFEILLPKEITRFIIPLINKNPIIQENIIKIARNWYYDLGAYGKSEMTFWLGRLEIKKYKEEGVSLLNEFYLKQKELINSKKAKGNYSLTDLKMDMFLLRGIYVSLIYSGDEDLLNEYLLLLLEDKLSNLINRGFHLEYYGDKPYDANKNMLDFEDNYEVGEKTMKHLTKKLSVKMKGSNYSPTLKLDLFTLCSLIQARIETNDNHEKFFQRYGTSKKFYYKECEECLNKYINQLSSSTKDKLSLYFMMFYEDIKIFNNSEYNNISSIMYDTCTKVSEIERTGWIHLLIPQSDRETVSEHIYNTWIMGMLYLPDEIDYRGNDYDKEKILKMILIHDLGEAVTGDIAKPLKKENPRHEEEEDKVMRKLMLKGTYESVENLNDYYLLWDEFNKSESINAKIAKDLDVIQMLYQFCKYYLRYPSKFTEEIKENWFLHINSIQTKVGKEIFSKLIKHNTEYSALF